MLKQSYKSNETELQFAALGAAINLLVWAFTMIAFWQLFVLLTQVAG